MERARRFGELIGLCFQIRDDIFDYFSDATIGKPTGNDMAEGKLTLPAIYALRETNNTEAQVWASHIKKGEATPDEIAHLVEFTKQAGGIDYAEQRMQELRQQALALLPYWQHPEVRQSLNDYIDFVVERKW